MNLFTALCRFCTDSFSESISRWWVPEVIFSLRVLHKKLDRFSFSSANSPQSTFNFFRPENRPIILHYGKSSNQLEMYMLFLSMTLSSGLPFSVRALLFGRLNFPLDLINTCFVLQSSALLNTWKNGIISLGWLNCLLFKSLFGQAWVKRTKRKLLKGLRGCLRGWASLEKQLLSLFTKPRRLTGPRVDSYIRPSMEIVRTRVVKSDDRIQGGRIERRRLDSDSLSFACEILDLPEMW